MWCAFTFYFGLFILCEPNDNQDQSWRGVVESRAELEQNIWIGCKELVEWMDDWLSHGWQVESDYRILVFIGFPKSARRNPRTSRVGWCQSLWRFVTTLATGLLTKAESLPALLASQSRLKEVRYCHLLDHLQRDTFSSGVQGDGRPVVEARQAWGLIMPNGSVITPRLLGKV